MKKSSLKHLFTGQIWVFFDSFYQALRSGELRYVWLLSMGVSMLFSGCSGPTQPGQTHCNIRKLYGSYLQNDSVVNFYDINNRVIQSVYYADGDTFSASLDYYSNQVIVNNYENGFLDAQAIVFLNSFGLPEIIYDAVYNDTTHYLSYSTNGVLMNSTRVLDGCATPLPRHYVSMAFAYSGQRLAGYNLTIFPNAAISMSCFRPHTATCYYPNNITDYWNLSSYIFYFTLHTPPPYISSLHSDALPEKIIRVYSPPNQYSDTISLTYTLDANNYPVQVHFSNGDTLFVEYECN